MTSSHASLTPLPAPSPTPPQLAASLAAALPRALAQLERCLAELAGHFPGDTTEQNRYAPMQWPGEAAGCNASWTAGFWTGLLWMGHELSGRHSFRQAATQQLPGYLHRLERRFVVDHHDLGFLYLPSCLAALRQGNRGELAASQRHEAKLATLQAAELLMSRYLPKAGVIQAWGQLDDPAQRGRIIIDCLLNLPLLHWASAMGAGPQYREAAISHALRSREHLLRPDHSSFHTFHFDPLSGLPLHGTTAQGAADNSCWARGQAWGIYGFALNHRWAPGHGFLDTAVQLAERFLADLPANGLAYWDLCYGPGSGQPWDSSASAIAACGLQEIALQLEEPVPVMAQRYRLAAERILDGLLTHCAGWDEPGCNALLRHGVYSKPEGIGVDEASLWGDYFFLEALARRVQQWTPHWYPATSAQTGGGPVFQSP